MAAPIRSTLKTPLVLILLGPPGAGKGTQAKLIQKVWGLPHISTGDLLRAHIQKGTDLGVQAKQFVDHGQLVADDLILNMLFERLQSSDCGQGYILDGVPRTLAQAKALQTYLADLSPLVINLELSDEQVVERLSHRVVCSTCGTPYHLLYSPPKVKEKCDHCGGNLIHRPDDTEEVIRKRLKIYNEQTAPLITFYAEKNLLHAVDCSLKAEEVLEKIRTIITQE